MKPQDFRLLIHHHHPVYLDDAENIWLTSTLGRWVSALSLNFKEIGLLLHQSPSRESRQDTLVPQKNVRLFSLGPYGNSWDRISRIQRIHQICRRVGPETDGLLIRGLTPRQYAVWKHTSVSRKAFLLVRSPRQERIIGTSIMNFLHALINRHHEYEFERIAKADTLMLVNSPIYLSEVEAISGKPAHFVPTNTIRISEFSPKQVRLVKTPCRLLFVGRLHYLKGLRELFQAISILNQHGQACVLDLVGGLEEPIHTQLLGLAHQLGIAEVIRWHGFIPFGPGLFKLYQEADIFILPSYTEGFPHVLWEAAANCCPIITTAVGGIPALFSDGKHGLLVPPKDIEALVGAVKRLLLDDPLRQRLVELAYRHALDFTVEACAQKLADTLSSEWN